MDGTRQLIVRWRDGETDARDRLIALLHPTLSQIAAARLRRERDSSLSSGDLINDAVLRLIRIRSVDIADRAHVIALASRLMRNILTDHARARRAAKRDGHRVALTTRVDGEQRIDLAELEPALIRLGALDPQLMEIVEMRYFGGMTLADIAAVTLLSEPTVKRRWQTARAWLADTLANPIENA
jgi:RNA polymerase sigma factor (TIGR02999 family)